MLFMLFPPPLPLPSSHGSLKNPSKPSSTEAQWTSRLRQVEKQVVVWQGGVWTQGLRQKGQFLRALGLVPRSCVGLPPPTLPHQTHNPKHFSRYTLKRKRVSNCLSLSNLFHPIWKFFSFNSKVCFCLFLEVKVFTKGSDPSVHS